MEKVPTTVKKSSKKRSLPQTDVDLAAVAAKAANAWAENDWLKIQWLSQAEFQSLVNDYTVELSERLQTGSTRPAITAAIRELETEIDNGMRYVKAYLFEKYGAAAKNHYHAFGLEKIGQGMRVPRDQNQKVETLSIVIQAIDSEGFGDKPYGKAYWLEKTAAYKGFLQQAGDIDSSVASKVGHKNQYRNAIIRGLNSIIWGLRSNFPDTFASEARTWGFQKEKY